MVAEKDNTKWKVKHLKIRGTGTRANRASDLRQWRIIAEREAENVLHIGTPEQVRRACYATMRKHKKVRRKNSRSNIQSARAFL